MNLAYQCFRLTLANNNDHAEAYNNLGVLELRKGNVDMVSQYFLEKVLLSLDPIFSEPGLKSGELMP